MNYTFKLSRRVARLRAAIVVVAAGLLVIGCSDSSVGPESASDPTRVSITPDSVSIGTSQATQFQASFNRKTTLSASATGHSGWRHNSVVDLTITPDTLAVPEGMAASFTAAARLSDGSTSEPSVTWTAEGGTIDAHGMYTAGTIPGHYTIRAMAANGVADTAAVVVTETPPIVTNISLSPTSVSLPVGGSKQFATVGKESNGTMVAVSPKYTATGGTVSIDGVYKAGQTAGTFRVIATDTVDNLADTSAVIIAPPPATVQAVVLNPTTASLAAGATQQFSATGKLSDGSTTSVTVTWSASGGTISTGLYTAGSVSGHYRVIATLAGGSLADTAAITITASSPTPPPPSSAPPPPSGSCARAVNVSSASGLSSAINNALPGDCIVMAPGTYSGGYPITRSGTAANPITLTGPRTAVIGQGSAGDGFTLHGASYWVLKGFRITGPTNGGVVSIGGNYNVLDSLEIDHTGTVGIAIKTADVGVNTATVVTGNVIRNNYIHDTGIAIAQFGEGIYLGDGTCACQKVRHTHVHHNTIGPTGAEPIEAKVMADSSLIEFNTIRSVNGVVLRSDYNIFNDNSLIGGPLLTCSGCSGALVGVGSDVAGDAATGNVFNRNTGSNAPKLFFDQGSGTRFDCDNQARAPTVLGVTCTP